MASPTILAFETSCDETAAAIVAGCRRPAVLANVVSSQAEAHGPFAGVVPELASRAHMERAAWVAERAMRKAFGAPLSELGARVDAVAYTRGPGLSGALLVGKVAAQTLAEACGLPLVGVNHLEAHLLAIGLAREARFPFVALVVSGGHTELVWVRAPGRYRVLGRTRDDAAGEVFDKVAKFLRLGYPGGPAVDRLARAGDPGAIRFPRALLPGTDDFSFSGLKTAVLYRVRDEGLTSGAVRPARPLSRRPSRAFLADLCASFQEAVVDTLTAKTLAAARRLGERRVVLGGGVAANSRLRSRLAQAGAAQGVEVLLPPLALCTDNAAMVALAAAHRLKRGRVGRRRAVEPSLPIRSWA